MTYPDRELPTDVRRSLGLVSRLLVPISSSHRFSIPLRWLGDLARRGSLSYPAGQENQKGRHLRWWDDLRGKPAAMLLYPFPGGKHLRKNLPWDLTVTMNGAEIPYKVSETKGGWTHYVPR